MEFPGAAPSLEVPKPAWSSLGQWKALLAAAGMDEMSWKAHSSGIQWHSQRFPGCQQQAQLRAIPVPPLQPHLCHPAAPPVPAVLALGTVTLLPGAPRLLAASSGRPVSPNSPKFYPSRPAGRVWGARGAPGEAEQRSARSAFKKLSLGMELSCQQLGQPIN